jgi:SAM-dependent methyltransferase
MRKSLLKYLCCPECEGELQLKVDEGAGDEIQAGSLACPACNESWAIRGGVPRFVTFSAEDERRATAENFGEQWLVFDHVAEHHRQQFRDWIAPVTPEFVRGKVVLEGGCGKGRHTRQIGEWGAEAVIGIDFSAAVEAAARNTADLANVHIIQADIYRLPLRRTIDYAFSVGVLHHLPDPRRGFFSLLGRVRPGGAISAWVYGRENNGWIVHGINPLRELLTSRMSMRTLYLFSWLPALLLTLLLRSIYRPLAGTPAQRYLFYGEYLGYIARFPFREIHNIVHDHLTAPIAFYLTRAEFAEWFKAAGTTGTEINWHNQNSWRGFGMVPESGLRPDGGTADGGE